VDQAIDSHEYPCPSGSVLQTVDPVAVLVGLLDSHPENVAQRLQQGDEGGQHCLSPMYIVSKYTRLSAHRRLALLARPSAASYRRRLKAAARPSLKELLLSV